MSMHRRDRHPDAHIEVAAKQLDDAASWLGEAAGWLRDVGDPRRLSDNNTYHATFWRVTHSMSAISQALDNVIRPGLALSLNELEDIKAGRKKADD